MSKKNAKMPKKTNSSPIPGWFKAVFAIVLLLCLSIVCLCTVDQPRLETELTELTASLDTSRQREAKQQAEYDEVAAQLPVTQAELAKIQPEADAVRATLDALKAERDALREQETALENELEALTNGNATLEAALKLLNNAAE